MAANLDETVQALAQYGLDPAQVLRDTNTNTVLRVVALLEDFFEITLSMKMLAKGEAVTDRMFRNNGKLATLDKKIHKARDDLRMLDTVANADAHLLRKIRNQFAHTRDALHFDSPSIVEYISQLSTYAAADTHQNAMFAAVTKVYEQLKAAVAASG